MLIYHPETEHLIEYVNGSLHPSISLCVSVHLDFCEQCRSHINKLEAIGGALLDKLDDAYVDENLLTNIFQQIDFQDTTRAGVVRASMLETDILPSSVKKLFNYDESQLNWRHHGGKVRSAELLNDKGIKASLIRLQQGANIPQHGHRGTEYTVVLDGSFSDEDGIYHKGDFLIRKPGDKHAPTATTDKDCWCLTALEAPLKFSNPLLEFVNRVMPL